MYVTCPFFRMMHRCVSAPSCCTFILKAAFQEVSEHRILIKSGPGNWSLSASGTTHKATYRISPCDRPHPELCREGRAPLQTKQGNRPTGHDQEGRRGLNEVVPGTSVFPLSETGVLGDFWGRIKGAKYRFAFQDGTWDIF